MGNSFLDSKGNIIKWWTEEEKRGGYKYYPPLGWIWFSINLYDKYDNYSWVSSHNNKMNGKLHIIMKVGIKTIIGTAYLVALKLRVN